MGMALASYLATSILKERSVLLVFLEPNCCGRFVDTTRIFVCVFAVTRRAVLVHIGMDICWYVMPFLYGQVTQSHVPNLTIMNFFFL